MILSIFVSLHISDEGISLIKKWEGLELTAYKDVVGVTTIGYGHTKTAKMGQKVTLKGAEKLLRSDLRHFEEGVARLVTVKLSQGQYDALVSLAYNIGLGAFKRSTLLRKLNTGDYTGASKEFTRWVYAGKTKYKGLLNRRLEERRLFVR